VRARITLRGLGASAVVLAAALASVVPMALAPAPAQAAECQDETHTGLPLAPTGCDDVTPPDTTLSVTPSPTSGGYIRASTVRFDFAGSYGSTGDTGPITFECQFYNTVTAPTTWNTCSSPQVFGNLAQSTSTPYTFKVRAVDANDDAIHACDATSDLTLCSGDPDIEDKDASPAVSTIKVDTTAPNTFLTRTPLDDIRPDWPVSLTRSPQVVLNSNEGGVGFVCEVNGKAQPCAEGAVTLAKLRSGPQKLTAQAVDQAGNADPTPSVSEFFVPDNIRASRGSGWTRIRRNGTFDGDLVQAKKVGSLLRIGGQRNVQELRLIAPAGPRLGRIAVRVGRSKWYQVNLKGKAAAQKTYVVRDQYAPPQSGAILIRVVGLPRGGTVQLDALVARR
jgi:hypothetical protein